MPLSAGQQLAVHQLRDIEEASAGELSLRRAPAEPAESSSLAIELSVVCRGIERAQGDSPCGSEKYF
jgi:hypothetical protein